jgi:hypothetical protein
LPWQILKRMAWCSPPGCSKKRKDKCQERTRFGETLAVPLGNLDMTSKHNQMYVPCCQCFCWGFVIYCLYITQTTSLSYAGVHWDQRWSVVDNKVALHCSEMTLAQCSCLLALYQPFHQLLQK